MSLATAAYCSACRAHVLLTPDGECEFGHPRSYLRGIYLAEVDRRTGRPGAPSAEQSMSVSRPLAPVAPVAIPMIQPSVAYEPSEGPRRTMTAPFAPVVSALGQDALSRAVAVGGRQHTLRRIFGRQAPPPNQAHANNAGLVSTPLLVALALVAMLAVVVSAVL